MFRGRGLSIESEFISDRRQQMRLYDKVSASSVDVVLGRAQGNVLEPLLSILYTSELFYIVGNHILSCAEDTTNYAIIPKPLSRPPVMKSLNRVLVPIHS